MKTYKDLLDEFARFVAIYRHPQRRADAVSPRFEAQFENRAQRRQRAKKERWAAKAAKR